LNQLQQRIKARTCEFFLASADFNGITASHLMLELGVSWLELREALDTLVSSGDVTLSFGSLTANAHIKRLPDVPAEEQLRLLAQEDARSVGLYPAASLIRTSIDISRYADRPYTLRLTQAEAQLVPVFFELQVLDRYYRDPRFRFDFGDFGGSISIGGEYYESDAVREKDQVFVSTFGIGYDSKRDRVVAVFLRYLADLSPEHQQYWKTYEVTSACTMNSDYARATINGEWPENASVYRALLQERIEINKLATMIGKPELFLNASENELISGFHPMLHPTRKNFDDFVHLFDKLLSESINRAFFEGEVDLARRVEQRDGSYMIEQKGTLQLLEEWLATRFYRGRDETAARDLLEPFREVRKLRQKPAHALVADSYDPTYARQQDALVGRLYERLNVLRSILAKHPKAVGYEPPEWLAKRRLVFY
jgi:hypothetical protein